MRTGCLRYLRANTIISNSSDSRWRQKEGKPLGTLSAVFETPGNDVYVVESGEKELLIPAIEDVICEVDLRSRKLIVDLPEGLQ